MDLNYWLQKSGLPSGMLPLPTLRPKSRILDLGCGGGRLAAALAYLGDVCGIDQSSELIAQGKVKHPGLDLICADFQQPWPGQFDLVVSNCAIRKDYCDLGRIAELCQEHLKEKGSILLRIQAFEDLDEVLPQELRQQLFYSRGDIESAFGAFRLEIKRESFRQRFSTVDYFQKFLNRIQVPQHYPRHLNPCRNYYIVRGT